MGNFDERQWGNSVSAVNPTFFGRATAYTFLDDARAALDAVREQTFRVSVS